MDKLWAPWRIRYITTLKKKSRGCVFCRMLRQKKDKKNLIFTRSKYSFAILNLYPYNNGHTMIMPYRHVGDFEKLTRAEQKDMFDLMLRTKGLLQKVLRPQGYNIGVNLGKHAGAGSPGHMHVHVVPRWRGDVNFMPVVADTKVISQSMTELYTLLVNAQKKSRK